VTGRPSVRPSIRFSADRRIYFAICRFLVRSDCSVPPPSLHRNSKGEDKRHKKGVALTLYVSHGSLHGAQRQEKREAGSGRRRGWLLSRQHARQHDDCPSNGNVGRFLYRWQTYMCTFACWPKEFDARCIYACFCPKFFWAVA